MLGKNWIWALALIVLAGGIAAATPVYGTAVSSSDWTGTRTLTPGGGLGSAPNPEHGWVFPVGSGISWAITNNGNGTFTYTYSFFDDKGKDLKLSHFILELSEGCIAGNQNQSSCIWGANVNLEYSTSWYSQGNSNPGIPNPIYGVKFGEESTYTFTSSRIPVWGNFYAKKGQDGLWNLGLETACSGSDNTGSDNTGCDNTLYFIPRPDTQTPEIPEPGTMALLGAGLTALGLLRRRN
jgi:hypothetical protein